MVYKDFRDNLLKPFYNRGEVSDALLRNFVNMAKLRIQRDYNLAFALGEATLTYPSEARVGVALPADFKGFFHSHSVMVAGVPIEGTTHETEMRRLYQGGETTKVRYFALPRGLGWVLYLSPEALGVDMRVTYYKWLPDYTSDNDEDFLTCEGRDVLLWESLRVGNMFQEDDAKVGINETAFQVALHNLRYYCENVLFSGSFVDVD